MSFQIVSDSSCDLGRERARALGVTLVSYYVSMDGKNYYREERDITAQAFYQQMADQPGVFPRTSMPTIEDYKEAFRPSLERGEAVLCICLNEPFSGSIQSARNAREELLEEFPQAEIRVLDSQLATVLQGLLVLEAAHMRDAGRTLEETAAVLEKNRGTGRIFFTTNDLEYLRHGGRIGRAAATTGALLRVKPLIGYEGNGLVSDGIAPGRKNSLNRVMELFYRYLSRNQLDLSHWSDHWRPYRPHPHRGGDPPQGGSPGGHHRSIAKKDAMPETFLPGVASYYIEAIRRAGPGRLGWSDGPESSW